MRKSYNLYQRILSFLLSLMMAFTSIPVTAVAEMGDETVSVENTGYYLHIDQQHGFGTILDTNEEKEYSSNYNDDMSKLLTKSAEYEAGENVELKIDVNEGLRLTDIIVKTDSGDEVDYDYDGECVTFAMPEDDVNVSITAEDNENSVVPMAIGNITATILKTDSDGNPLPGALLQVIDEFGDIIDEWTTTNEAHVVTGLEGGTTHYVHEVSAPDTYLKADDIEFTTGFTDGNTNITMVDEKAESTQTLTIEKIVGRLASNGMYDDFFEDVYGSEDFTFELTLNNGDYFNGTHIINGVEFIDGVGTFTLNGGNPLYTSNAKASITFELPAGTQFKVKELAKDNYKPSYSIAGIDASKVAYGEGIGRCLSTDTEILNEGDNATVTFTNVYIDDTYYEDMFNPTVTVTKNVVGKETDEEFEVTVYLSRLDAFFNGNYYAGTHVINGVTFVDGVGTFTLKNGESKTFDVLYNTFFRVEEKDYTSYETTYSTSYTWNTLSVEDEEEPVNPNIRASASGHYTVRKLDSYGRPLEGATFQVVGQYENQGVIDTWTGSYHSKGIAGYSKVYLSEVSAPEGYKRDETVHEMTLSRYSDNIYDFTIVNFKEDEPDNLNNWGISYGGNDTVTITNTYDPPKQTLTIHKLYGELYPYAYVNDFSYSESREDFTFKLTLSNGDYFDGTKEINGITFVDGVGTFTLRGGLDTYWSPDDNITFEGLPVGTKFKVEELANEYRPAYNITGTNVVSVRGGANANESLSTEWETLEANEEALVEFTNVYIDWDTYFEDMWTPSTITIAKEVVGNDNTDEEFEITLYLSNQEEFFGGNYYTGTQVINGVEFTDGVGKFKLKNGESKTFEVLLGTYYRVIEEELSNYDTTYSVVENFSTMSVEDNLITPYASNTAFVEYRARKIDSFGNLLEGAKFQTVIKETGEVVDEWDTPLFKGDLFDDVGIIREVEAPEGYELSDDTYILYPVDQGISDSATFVNWKKDEPKTGAWGIVDSAYIVNITNTYTPVQTLTVSKVVKKEDLNGNLTVYDNNNSYPIYIFFENLPEGFKLETSEGVKTVNPAEGVHDAPYTFYYMKNGDSIEIYNLPVGTRFNVVEFAIFLDTPVFDEDYYYPSYQVTGLGVVQATANGEPWQDLSTEIETLEAGESATVIITNTYVPLTGNLVVQKQVEGIQTKEEFEFTVTLESDENSMYPNAYDGEMVLNGVTFIDGVGTFKLKAGDSKEFKLYYNTTYKVEEKESSKYSTSCSCEVINPEAVSPAWGFFNSQSLVFLVTKTDQFGAPLAGARFQLINAETGEIEDEYTSTEEGYVELYSDDLYEFDGNGVLIDEPITYIIREIEAPAGYKKNDKDFIITANDWVDPNSPYGFYNNYELGQGIYFSVVNNKLDTESVETPDYIKGTILNNKYSVITVVNTFATSNITLKKVVSNIETDRKFTIQAEFENLIPNTTYYLSNGENFTADADGKYTYMAQLGHNEELVFMNIPVATKYRFTEIAGDYKASYNIVDNNKR